MSTQAAAAIPARKPAPARNNALDFTKGSLVLIMVFYHWLNYFVGQQSGIYTYIRFLTPSFIFISGFVVSNIYLTRYDVRDRSLPWKLVKRGAKILAVCAALNMFGWVVKPSYRIASLTDADAISDFFAVYVNGSVNLPGHKMAFPILVPIGALLILAAVLVVLLRRVPLACELACGACFATLIALATTDLDSPNLGLIAIGLLGVVFGRIPLPKIMRCLYSARYVLPLLYAGYLVGLWRWGAIYPLQIIGVCLNVVLLYLLGTLPCEKVWIGKHTLLLGKYSLFGYISQIAILQILKRIVPDNDFRLPLSFVLAFALTMASVEMMDFLRARARMIDRMYKVVFA